jgi:hypothetical protein
MGCNCGDFVKLKYMGVHQTPGVYEVRQGRVADLVATGQWMLVEDTVSKIALKKDYSKNVKK